MRFLDNNIFFNALEQFDILKLTSFPFSTLGFTNLILFCLIILTVIGLFFQMSQELPILNNSNFFKLFTYNFIFKLMSENINVSKQTFIPTVYFVFLFILMSNVSGLIPYSLTVTSYFVVTSFFAWGLFLGINIIGVWINRWQFFCLFLPGGAPSQITFLLIPIEIISYMARVVSLAIRLFANMMAGHALLKILGSFLWTFMTSITFLSLFSWIPLSIVLGVTILETLIAFLQAYVFITLTSIYLNDVINLH